MEALQSENACLKRGAWTADEDLKLIEYITKYRIWNWTKMPKYAGLKRSGKSCRLRWMNYLRPDIKRGNITAEERQTIVEMHQNLGNRWSAIATKLPGRTDNEIKNYWHTNIRQPPKRKQKGTKTKADGKIEPNAGQECLNSAGDSSLFFDESTKLEEENALTSQDSYKEEDNVHDDAVIRLSCDNLSMRNELKTAVSQEWYQVPTSPYAVYNYEYWFDVLFPEDISIVLE